jgi:putative nucleotidyltransferase with HDIG domain
MKKEKILVIDDDAMVLQLSEDILKRTDYEVKTAADGAEGIRLIEKETFDLIITDVKMPHVGGIELISHVREHDSEIPIIVVTGHGTLDTAISSLKLGAQGFILKPFTPAELRAAVSEAFEKTRLLSENIRMRALMPLFEVSREIIGEIDPKKLLQLIVEVSVRETGADRAWIAMIDEETGRLQPEEQYGMSPDFMHAFEDAYSEHITGTVLTEKKPFMISAKKKMEGLREAEGISTGVCVPLTVRGNTLGVLCIGRTFTEQPFTQSEIELVSVLGGQAAAAIENARLYGKLEDSYLAIIITLSSIVEARDQYTDKHMKDIAEYSVKIARKLHLSEEDIDNIRKAALLHDLGKVSVPDSILLKSGELSEEEMEIIKRHPVSGAKMIEPVEPLRQAQKIIMHHQECFDGSGYPDGLRGEEIPLGARIVAVADAFGAMTTDRPYRKALSVEEAVAELRKYAHVQFDPHIVEMFVAVLGDKGLFSDPRAEEPR